ncbi:MAG: hypothetical protein V1818_01560 [Candidatus Aenigmatarchaeota archaeon]
MFGLGKKKVAVVLEKFNFSKGDTIKGKVILDLKPTKAKALKVGIYGEKKTRTTSNISGNMNMETKTVKVFDFEQKLDGEKEYSKGEYKFNMKIPRISDNPSLPNNNLGTLIKAGQILSGKDTEVRWFVTARLDLPLLDIKDKVQINIG